MFAALSSVKIAVGAVIIALLLAAAGLAKVEYDHAARLATQLETATATLAAHDAEAVRVQTALSTTAAAAAARADAAVATRNRIHAAPTSTACASSPAVGALLDSLRQPSGVPTPAPGRAVRVP